MNRPKTLTYAIATEGATAGATLGGGGDAGAWANAVWANNRYVAAASPTR